EGLLAQVACAGSPFVTYAQYRRSTYGLPTFTLGTTFPSRCPMLMPYRLPSRNPFCSPLATQKRQPPSLHLQLHTAPRFRSPSGMSAVLPGRAPRYSDMGVQLSDFLARFTHLMHRIVPPSPNSLPAQAAAREHQLERNTAPH